MCYNRSFVLIKGYIVEECESIYIRMSLYVYGDKLYACTTPVGIQYHAFQCGVYTNTIDRAGEWGEIL